MGTVQQKLFLQQDLPNVELSTDFQKKTHLISGGANLTVLLQRFAVTVFVFAIGGFEWGAKLNFLPGFSVCNWNKGSKNVFCEDDEESVA